MRVLVACEYSGAVRDAFLALGHDAMSCDLLPTDAPGPHYQGDVFENDRRSWPAQHRAFQQALTEARWAVKAANLEPVVGANVTLHYRPSTKRRQDADGIAPTLKPCLDALVLEGVLPDDSWVHVTRTAQEFHEPSDDGPALWVELTPPDGEAFQAWEVGA